MGFFRNKEAYNTELLKMIGWKMFYYSYTLILPLIVVPLAWWLILLAFIGMHFVAGVYISLVFQTAHVMPEAKFPLPDRNGQMGNEWALHQLATTTNYAPKSKFFSWLIGGLNFQIEHHLLPDICHIHYKNLSHIVSGTAKEFGIPYHTKQNFIEAIRDHTKMLQQLGR
jgi:linoleoyl-CoA desaturase